MKISRKHFDMTYFILKMFMMIISTNCLKDPSKFDSVLGHKTYHYLVTNKAKKIYRTDYEKIKLNN